LILAINTSTSQFSTALVEEDGVLLAEYFMASLSKNYNALMPAIHSIFTESKSNIQDIKAVMITKGPGSFTGMRVGLATAKGMAQSLNIPVIAVSSLEALANQMPYTAFPLRPIIDSRKGEVFTALFHWSHNQKMIRIQEDTCLKIEDFPSVVNERTLFLGNNFNTQGPLIYKVLGQEALLAPSHLWNLRASAVATAGLKRFLEEDFDDLQDLVPSYLRPPHIRTNPLIK